MYTNMCICICVCHVHTCFVIYIIYICRSVLTHTHTRAHAHTHTHVPTQTHTNAHVHVGFWVQGLGSVWILGFVTSKRNGREARHGIPACIRVKKIPASRLTILAWVRVQKTPRNRRGEYYCTIVKQC